MATSTEEADCPSDGAANMFSDRTAVTASM